MKRLMMVVVLITAAACKNDPKTYAVEVLDGQFSPSSLSVPLGSTVGWSWNGANEHQVRFRDSQESEVQVMGSYGRRFDTPGTYRYECAVHSIMGGVIFVQ